MLKNQAVTPIFIAVAAVFLFANVASAEKLDTQAQTAVSQVEKPKAKELSSEFVFKYLAAEFAGQRGDLGLASSLFFELAKSNGDARLAERAAKTAIYANSPAATVQAVALWAELDPESTEAQQASMQVLVSTGKLNEAKPYLQKLLLKEDTRANGFLYLNGLFARQVDKPAVLSLVQSLAEPYQNLPEAHFTIANAAWAAKNEALALDELKLADGLRQGWELASVLKGQILLARSPNDALAFYQSFLKQYPKANDVRLNLARLLMTQKRLAEAKVEFVELAKIASDNPEILVVVGLLSSQAGEYAEADKYFQQALDKTTGNDAQKNLDQIFMYLGQNAERQKNDVQALTWYQKVLPGERYLDAKMSIAYVTARTQNADAAIAMLDKLPELTNTQLVTVTQTKAVILTREKRHSEAYKLLEKAVDTLPNTPEIVYEFAMTAERLNKLDVMEKQLRKLFIIKPDFAAAYNALGYSFADRNIKLEEANTLIEKALLISPDDHYILDSMGWLKFRMGELDKAIDYLQKAYNIQNDPDIAAHIAEVLWKQGKQDEANELLDDAMKTYPDNEALINTSKKLKL